MAHVHRKKHARLYLDDASSESYQKPSAKNVVIPTNVDKASLWRVIAPYVTLVKKGLKPDIPEDHAQFSIYLQKRPALLLHDISSFLYDSADMQSLFFETAEVLKTVTKAAGVSVYLVDRPNQEIYYTSMSGAVSERHRVRWRIEEGTIMAAFVANKKEYVMVDDVLDDDRFPEGLGYEGSTTPKSVLCVPVITPEGECIAVIELYRRVFQSAFTKHDLRISIMVTAWMGVAIHQNQERLDLKRQQELNDYLVELVKVFFGNNVHKEKLMSEVIKFAKRMLGAERGSFFIVDQENNNEMVGYLFDENNDSQYKRGMKMRFGKGIAGLVAKSGVTMNIKDAYQDSRFNKEIDQATGYITRSILCMPIIGAHGVLGVVQVINKTNGGWFTNMDETLFNTFSLYCALALHYTNIDDKTSRAQHENTINLKIVQLMVKPCIHDYEKFIQEREAKLPNDFESFSWYIDTTAEYKETPHYCLYMFLQIINPADVNVEDLMKFILSAKKLYRDIPYHNFEHAFNVCHCMYAILKRNLSQFTPIEIKALIISALCHDMDHVGSTNNFLTLIKHDLAQLYQRSVLENHHYQVTMMLLQTYDIYPNLSEADLKIMKDEIQRAILATDLALYFEKKAQMIKLINEKTFNWTNKTHRHIVKAIMMTACDLSGQCKPFLIARRVTDNLYREFYRQGDLEKEMGLCPLSIMDRDKEYCIPEDQIQFLKIIVIPCVELLRVVLPNTAELYLGAVALRKTWQELVNARGKKVWRQDDSVVPFYT